jgi:hypothetical protein
VERVDVEVGHRARAPAGSPMNLHIQSRSPQRSARPKGSQPSLRRITSAWGV